jgi:molybdenum cofactor synthesis domain-containing protein
MPENPPAQAPKAKTAAALIIGNEILSGKVDEANLGVLARALRSVGILLARVVMVPDDVGVIAREVALLSAGHDWLFTSGGVGPTHDDVTIEAVARAFGVAVVSDPDLETMIRAHYSSRATPAKSGHLRMALVPEGAALEALPEVPWPTVRMKNTWVMPGVPEAFRMKIPVVVACLRGAPSFVSHAVYTKMDEGDLKPLLDRVVSDFPDVEVGSYPKWNEPTYRTKLTFDGLDELRVEAARDAFVASLPGGEPQRLD